MVTVEVTQTFELDEDEFKSILCGERSMYDISDAETGNQVRVVQTK